MMNNHSALSTIATSDLDSATGGRTDQPVPHPFGVGSAVGRIARATAANARKVGSALGALASILHR
jgi:hypothetical protein